MGLIIVREEHELAALTYFGSHSMLGHGKTCGYDIRVLLACCGCSHLLLACQARPRSVPTQRTHFSSRCPTRCDGST